MKRCGLPPATRSHAGGMAAASWEGDRAQRGGGAAPDSVPAPPPAFGWSPSPFRGGSSGPIRYARFSTRKMKMRHVALLACFLALACSGGHSGAGKTKLAIDAVDTGKTALLIVTSPAFGPGATIP